MKEYLQQRWFRITVITILILAGTLLFIQLFSQTSFNYDSLSFKLKMDLGKTGGTVIAIPPVGQLFLKTHLTPWELVITLDEVDFSKLEKQLSSIPPKQEWLAVFQKQAQKAALTLFASVFFCGLLGSLFILIILRIHPLSKMFRYGLFISIILMLLLITSTVLTYSPKALEHPQYQGVLAAAPWAMNLLTMSLDNIEVIGANLKKISQGLPILFKQAGEMKNMGELQTDLAVLHVSDIHNNPAAFDLIEELVSSFKINFIIDTGDLTDYGTALEAKIIGRFSQIKVPYVFIPGNHDSPFILRRLAKKTPVILVIKNNLKLYGLTITGEADPAAFNYSSDVLPDEEYAKAGKRLMAKVKLQETVPDIIAVHSRNVAEDLIGSVPLIIHGHDHQYNLSVAKNTVIEDAGTTGAAGIRGLTNNNGVPYSASILYWKKDNDGKLLLHAIDSIKINGLEGSLTIDRKTF